MRDFSIPAQTTTEAATNCWTQAEARIAEILPKQAAYLSMLDVLTEGEAAALTYLDEPQLPENSEVYEVSDASEDVAAITAFGVVTSPIEEPYQVVRPADNAYQVSGVILVHIERTMRGHSERDPGYYGNEGRWFKNRLGDLLGQIYDYVQAQGGPFIHHLAVTAGPYRVDAKDAVTEGRWQAADVSILWGEGVRT